MRAELRKPSKSTSSFSNRENILRKPLRRRKSLRSRCAFCRGHSRSLRARHEWIWAEPPEPCPDRARVVWAGGPHRLYPSTWASLRACEGVPTATPVPRTHREHCPAIEKGLWPFEHTRQPYETWCSIRLGTYRWNVVFFFRAPVPSGWTLIEVESKDTASSLIRTICSTCNFSKTRSRTPLVDHRLIRI
jgi:hypothetical protein